MSTDALAHEPATTPRWRPLGAIERRALGVLIEKAKTTPENYPLSLNSLRAGCNQKNNRAPLMQLEESQLEEALDALRQAGAVLLVQGDSRVDRYRHLAYEWLGVDKVELAVMAELLLRGAQTVGELRGRAARMEPIKDLGELGPILSALEAKRLVVHLSPPGRGSVVTHTLYLDREMEKVRREAGTIASGEPALEPVRADASQPGVSAVGSRRGETSQREAPQTVHAPRMADDADEIRGLREDVASLKRELKSVQAELDSTTQQFRRELDELNRQVGN
ncbi:MAG: DUF480 domain-containing protein [Pirellulales bacterium]